MAVPQPIGETHADVLAKCIAASAFRYDVHRPKRAPIPPTPVRIAYHGHTKHGHFARSVIPAYSANHVCSKFSAERKPDNWVKCPGILLSSYVGRLEQLLEAVVDGQVLPKVLSLHAKIP